MTAAARTRGIFWALVIAGWAAALALGGAWIHRHPRQAAPAAAASTEVQCLEAAAKRQMPGFTAKRSLAVNHLIRQEDLDWAGASGAAQQSDILWRYSRCTIEAGHRVIAAETAAIPTIKVPAGRVSHPFPLDGNAVAAGAINAGTVLDIFDGRHVAARGVSVLALQCRFSSTDACVAILGVAPDDVPRLNAADAKSALLMITAKP